MYDEQLGWPRAAWSALVALAAFLVVVAVMELRQDPAPSVLPLLAVLALLGGIGMVFRQLHITLDETMLSVGFGPFRDRLPLERIVACNATTYHWWKYGGWGIRGNLRHPWQRTKLYNVLGDRGRAVEVILDDGRRVLFSARDPAAVCQVLQERHPDIGENISP